MYHKTFGNMTHPSVYIVVLYNFLLLELVQMVECNILSYLIDPKWPLEGLEKIGLNVVGRRGLLTFQI